MDEFTSCSVCARTPLIGEWVTLRGDSRPAPVCQLCLERPRARALGEVSGRERVQSRAGAEGVRPLRPAPMRPLVQPQLVGTSSIS